MSKDIINYTELTLINNNFGYFLVDNMGVVVRKVPSNRTNVSLVGFFNKKLTITVDVAMYSLEIRNSQLKGLKLNNVIYDVRISASRIKHFSFLDAINSLHLSFSKFDTIYGNHIDALTLDQKLKIHKLIMIKYIARIMQTSPDVTVKEGFYFASRRLTALKTNNTAISGTNIDSGVNVLCNDQVTPITNIGENVITYFINQIV